ncbi:phosphoesterase RecJ-like protein [Catenuloplanes nepalensis]|uniref:Phosphoesterase RecJ-like protein n=1 Tax=Catenuloplanes nepalensis TaxID=587533 RepID=A0ABT9N059_9ACTN|nr:phosphoesterase RecJ-like protein [Catenuloplanes nepalensis]
MTAAPARSIVPPPRTAAEGTVGPPRETDWVAAAAAVRRWLPDGRILLVCHVNPDGDALGSMLGFAHGLRRLGARNLQATFPGPFDVPEPLREVPGVDRLVPETEAWAEPDLLVTFDAASTDRLGALASRLSTARDSVVLDHHASNPGFGAVRLVDPAAAATSVVVEQLLDRLDVPLDAEIAECLYTALTTDTGSFRFAATTPAVHQMAARLVATGIHPGEISQRVFDSRPLGAVKLFGEVLGRCELDPAAAAGHGLCWTTATLADLEKHGQRPHVLEALIDSVRCVAEADVCVVLKQVGEDTWSVSMRSKGAVDVSRVAGLLGGGGHRAAAGFTGSGSPADVLASIRSELDESVIR